MHSTVVLERLRQLGRARLRDLIRNERARAKVHVSLIRRFHPHASPDRVAQMIVHRMARAASVEGGFTGTLGWLGIPLHLVAFAYLELALVVHVAEAYDVSLEGEDGEDTLLSVLGRAHGVEDLVRASPRILGAIARTVLLKRGFASLGRMVPLIAGPLAARMNERAMNATGLEALRRLGKVVDVT